MLDLTKRFLPDGWGSNAVDNVLLGAWIAALVFAVVVTSVAPS